MEAATQKQTAIVTIADVEAPGEGKKKWKVFDQDGHTYYATPDVARLVKATGVYEISFVNNPFRDMILKNLIYAKQLTAPTGAVATPQQATAVEQKVVARKATENMMPRQPTHPKDGERMWCCAILEAFIKAGKVELEDLGKANQRIALVYANSWGKQDKPRDADLDDEIPGW